MAKDKTIFTCSDCGGTTPRWLGKCPACGAWNTLIESTLDTGGNAKNRYTSQFQALAKTSELTKLGDIEATDVDRSPPASKNSIALWAAAWWKVAWCLIGGDPGIGKSTLLLQALDALQRKGMNTLYVTGEESGAQVALRSRRLGLDHSQVQVLAEIQLEKILATLQTERPPHRCH
jgi:DNA repair protein RadA/Sms